MNLKRIVQTIKRNERFLISTHVHPDPDALCSELALSAYLKSLGKRVMIINEDKVPDRYKFLPGIRQIKTYQKKMKKFFDVALIVDCGELSRVGKVTNLIDQQTAIVNIDHHITNDRFGHLNFVVPDASSTAEVLYDLFKYAKARLSKNQAYHLYTGIMTDTGSFRYENTKEKTHGIVSDLMSAGFSVSDVYRKLYEQIPMKDIKLFTRVINGLNSYCRGKVVCVNLRKALVSKFSESFDLKDELFKFLRCIQGVEVFVILTEISAHQTRVNLRSSKNFNVAKLASRFDGGGHPRASGCIMDNGISMSQKRLLAQIRKEI